MKILVVEDDLSLSDVLVFTLRRAGYLICTAYDGVAALAQWAAEKPDLLVLDLNLPKLDGLEVCRRIRQEGGDTPIIMLSVRAGDEVIVAGLELGADDYMVKPFSPNQLVARIRAVLRRAGVAEGSGVLQVGNLWFDRERHEVRVGDGELLRLTPLEAELLGVLMVHVGQVLPGERLITAVWGLDGGDRTMLKQLIYRLRQKIDPPGTENSRIETIPGLGYSLVEK
jgi:DNA-binding response OmpR family regulator